MNPFLHQNNPSSQQPVVLLVDDSPENLRLMGDALRASYLVRVANSGEKAVIAAGREPIPDIVLLDVLMPGMDGYETYACLRELPPLKDVPVIFVTSLNDIDSERHGLALGAVDYISKPINTDIMLARVKCQLELKMARDRLDAQNHYLEEEVSRRVAENEMIRDLTIRALAKLAEERDNETGKHIVRTQNYVRILSVYLSQIEPYSEVLTHDYVDSIIRAAPLHDVGKVGIPDAILLKPGKLTPEEFETMKRHSVIGANAIDSAIQTVASESAGNSSVNIKDSFAFLYTAEEIARSHHEKWDGSGYPDGLSGEDIPLSARIMALADVFDALTTKRVYKPAFDLESATRIIIESRGTHFDPQVVDAYIANQNQFWEIARNLADG